VIVAGGDDGNRETELGVLLPRANDAGRDRRRAVVHEQAGSGRNRLELLEANVQPVARPVRLAADEGVPAPELAPLHPRQRERDPLARGPMVDRLVVHLHRSHPHAAAARLDPENVPAGNGAGPERSRHNRPDPAQREDAIDVQARRGAELVAL